MRRREFITLLGSAAVWPSAAHAQQPAKVHRVAVLSVYPETSPAFQSWLAAFRQGLEKLGWIEGQNIRFEYRWVGSDPNLMQQGAKELVALQPDLIISSSSPTTGLLLQQTHTIPIVFVNIVDPVGQGFISSMSRPGGNATGVVNLEPSMAGKWIGLLKQVVPYLARVVVPFNPISAPYADLYLNYFKSAAPSFDVEVAAASVADLAELESAVAAQANEPNTGLILMPSGFISGHYSETAAMTIQHHLPAIYSDRGFAEAGGLLSYGNDVIDNWRRAPTFVNRILNGEKPADLPVELPVKFNLVVNLKTARALGLTIPQSLVSTADEVVE